MKKLLLCLVSVAALSTSVSAFAFVGCSGSDVIYCTDMGSYVSCQDYGDWDPGCAVGDTPWVGSELDPSTW
jgi:hypothetical protein